jgi:ribosome-interacting GTPase 1
MLSTVPKHKGTERLRYELKKSLAKQQRELQARALKKVSSGSDFHIQKEGIAQVSLIGPPNSGKSLILNRLTSSRAKVAPYPFTSTTPSPGMLVHEDVQIQVVEIPALIQEVSEGRWLGPKMLSLIRNADALIIVLHLSDHPVKHMKMTCRELDAAKIRLNKTRPKVIVKRTDRGGLQLEGDIDDADRYYVTNLLLSRGFHNASVIFLERIPRDDVADAFDDSVVFKPTLVLANKGDLPGTEDAFEELKDVFGKDFAMIPVSAEKRIGLEDVGRSVYDILSVIRLYTKIPRQDPEKRPLVLGAGCTVRDVAESLHRRFITNFRFARVWGSSVNFGGEMVGLGHSLADGDVVEVHAK